jgi:hypothetical protein
VGIGGVVLAGVLGVAVKWSGFMTETGAPLAQPVPFSHKHHVSGLGLDCRYCHATVERTATAGMPSTHTCMTCHSQIWPQAKLLEPVRTSYKEHKPLEWNRVYRVPKYVYFNHSIHIEKGVACATCHGQVEQMPLVRKERSFYMRDCLSCHRDVVKANAKKQRLTDCMTCHR